MALNALSTIGKLGIANVAYRLGYKSAFEHPVIKQAKSDSALEEFASIVGVNVAFVNAGMMTQMQSDPAATSTQCY